MTDPRAALAAYDGVQDADNIIGWLAERGVLLVTEPMLAAVIYDLKRWMQRTDAAEAAAAIFAALSADD